MAFGDGGKLGDDGGCQLAALIGAQLANSPCRQTGSITVEHRAASVARARAAGVRIAVDAVVKQPAAAPRKRRGCGAGVVRAGAS